MNNSGLLLYQTKMESHLKGEFESMDEEFRSSAPEEAGQESMDNQNLPPQNFEAPQWGYYEVMVGAIFTATPLTLMALALPLLRRLETHGMRPWLMSCLAVAAVLVVFDSHVGGLGWRYSADFGWLISLASIPGLLWLVNGREPSRSLAGANDAASGDGIARVTPWRWLMRWVVMLAVLWALGIAILSCFVQSRSDSMIANNPTLWHQVQSWFTLL